MKWNEQHHAKIYVTMTLCCKTLLAQSQNNHELTCGSMCFWKSTDTTKSMKEEEKVGEIQHPLTLSLH